MTAPIREPMTAITEAGDLDVELQYDPADPLAVGLHFPGKGFAWTFARDLLVLGSRSGKVAGEGDVRVLRHPALGRVTVELSSPDGSLRLHLPAEPTRWFIDRTTNLVPLGEERVDIDRLIERLVAS